MNKNERRDLNNGLILRDPIQCNGNIRTEKSYHLHTLRDCVLLTQQALQRRNGRH